jgi:hypothetical protein
MSGKRTVDRPPSPDTLVVDVAVEDFEEFDFDSNIVPPEPPAPPALAQGSETHDRSAVRKQLDALSKPELDALLLAYLMDRDHDPRK